MRTHTRPSIVGRLRGLVLALALLLAPLLGLAATPAQAASGDCATANGQTICTFSYSGAPETWTVPFGVTEATFNLYGAQGGGADGGKGGRVTATLAVTAGASYQILVGGQNGFNGGGAGPTTGGGASDVRTGANGLQDRLLVAGGGGGSGGTNAIGEIIFRGGDGGYPEGATAEGFGYGRGGSQTGGGGGGSSISGFGGNGSLGQGGDGNNGGSGGGGGYYGGGGGAGEQQPAVVAGAGGGGSSYGPAGATFENGVRTGDGLVIISYDLPVPDTTAPTASPTQSPAANAAGWNTNDITVSWNWSDNAGGSGIDPNNCTTSSTSIGEGEQTLSAACKDRAGNQGSASYAVKVDKTAPTLAPTISPSTPQVGQPANARPNATDTLSGIASQNCDALDTSTVGTKSVSCTASDNAGNTASKSVTYQVTYTWSGFFQPVDNLPTVNSVKAGQAIRVVFSLGGNQGLNIFASGYPKVQQVACASGSPIDEIEQTVTAGASSLSYDAASGQYNYTWKTDKSWAKTCRQLVLKLVDGSEHTAGFQFR